MRYQHFSRRIILGLLATIGTLAHASEPESPTPTKPLPPMPSDEDADENQSASLPEVPSDEEDAPAAAEDAEDALPTGHQDCALAILRLLSDTELCLNGCRDAASVQAALPRFRELSERAHRLAEVQRHLPEPTSQDLISMNQHMERFNLLWGAIGDHIHRLEKAGLVSHELRDILHLAPPPAPAPAKPAEDATPDESTEAPAAPSAAGPSAEPPSESPKAPGTPSA